MEYFVDREKYSFWILLHINVAFFFGLTAVVGMGTMLYGYLRYTCGMFKIARYERECENHKNADCKSNLAIFKETF